jgi:hypothetical protein
VVFTVLGIAFLVGVAVLNRLGPDSTSAYLGDGRRVPGGRARSRAGRALLAAAATIGAFMSPTALANGRRSPRKLLRDLIARLLGRIEGKR